MASRATSVAYRSSFPNLGDLTFDVEPRREWTPPHADSIEHRLWDSPRTSAAYLSANPYRPGRHVNSSLRLSVDQPGKSQLQPELQPPPTQPQPQSQPSAQASNGGDLARGTTPRRISPPRVVFAEPSLSQMPSAGPGELPSVRGQTAILASPTPPLHGTHHYGGYQHHHGQAGGGGGGAAAPPAGILAGGSSRRGSLAAQGMPAAAAAAAAAASPPPDAQVPGPAPAPATGAGAVAAAAAAGGAGGLFGVGLLDHMSTAMASSQQPSAPDPVETYLARYQLHQRIHDGFRVRADQHVRTVQELGSRIQGMTRVPSPPKRVASKGGDKEKSKAGRGDSGRGSKTGKAGGGRAGSKDAEDTTKDAKEGQAAAATAETTSTDTAAGTDSTGAAPSALQAEQGAPAAAAESPEASSGSHAAASPDSGPPAGGGGGGASSGGSSPPRSVRITTPSSTAPPLPEPPLGRNRFVPLPLPAAITSRPRSAAAATSAGDVPTAFPAPATTTSSLSSPPSPSSPSPAGAAHPLISSPRASLVFRPESLSGGPQQLQELALQQQVEANQGAYLALPDGSFAGSAPFRAVPTQEGLLFEKYARRGKAAADLPALQLRYLRPPTTAPREPRHLKKIPRQPPPPARALPNGIPASRLERLSARRRSRSPPRFYTHQQHHQQPPFSPSGGGGGDLINATPAGLGDGLLRSSPLLTSGGGPRAASAPQSSGAAAAGGGAGGGGTLAQYLAVSTAPTSGEPLLDENFYDVLQQHFRSTLHQQTAQLRAQLNVNLPAVLGALNCVNVTEPLGAAGPPAPGSSAFALAGLGPRAASAGAGAVAGRMGR